MNEMMMQAMQAYQEMQKRVAEVQGRLEQLTTEQEGGDGLVKVTATADGRIAKVAIDPERLSSEEHDVIEDVIASTVNKALQSAEATREQEMQKATEGLMPNIPGMNVPPQG
jgi:hypothetical protein